MQRPILKFLVDKALFCSLLFDETYQLARYNLFMSSIISLNERISGSIQLTIQCHRALHRDHLNLINTFGRLTILSKVSILSRASNSWFGWSGLQYWWLNDSIKEHHRDKNRISADLGSQKSVQSWETRHEKVIMIYPTVIF